MDSNRETGRDRQETDVLFEVAVGRLVWHHGFAWLYIAQLSFLCT